MKTSRLHAWICFIGGASALGACGGNAPTSQASGSADDVAAAPASLVNGTPVSLADQRRLGLVKVSGPGFFCSGTLVARDWVLTAAHCLLSTPNLMQVTLVDGAGGTASRVPDRAETDGAVDINAMLGDLALLHLGGAAPPAWPASVTMPIDTRPFMSLANAPVTSYGIGLTTIKNGAFGDPAASYLSGNFTVASDIFTPDSFVAHRISVDRPINAPGDSGGPCISFDASGTPSLVGVLHGLSYNVDADGGIIDNENMLSQWVSTSVYRQWILDTIATDIRRTIVFMYGPTIPGQDMFLRGGIDHAASANLRHVSCVNSDGTTPNYQCAIPLYLNNDQFNGTAKPWLAGDRYLDWYGPETSTPLLTSGVSRVWGPASLVPQIPAALGTPANWTTNNTANANKVAVNGFGYTPMNHWGDHNWMVDVMMDCSKAFKDSAGNPWFEVKSFISNGPGWEGNVTQGTVQGFTPPYASANHFAICGMTTRLQRGTSTGTEFATIPSPAPAVEIASPPLY